MMEQLILENKSRHMKQEGESSAQTHYGEMMPDQPGGLWQGDK